MGKSRIEKAIGNFAEMINKPELKEHFRRLELLVSEFVRLSPEFESDLEIAKAIGIEVGNVKWELQNERQALVINE